MIVEITTDEDIRVRLDVEYRSWTGAHDSWTATPTGTLGASQGHWFRVGDLDNSVMFYGKDVKDQILWLHGVATRNIGNPFPTGSSGQGEYESDEGLIKTGVVLNWKVL